MSAGFTPGPWVNGLDDVDAVYAPNTLPGNIICEPPSRDASYKKWRLNATLIAAAPDLYEALQQFVNGVETHMIDSPADDILANVTRQANAALAKARGERVQL